MSSSIETGQNTKESQSNKVITKSTPGRYEYPLFSKSKLKEKGPLHEQPHLTHIRNEKTMNYHFNSGLCKGQVFRNHFTQREGSSPESKLIYADFNKMRIGNSKLYKDDIKSILKSANINKYDRIRDLLREEMWNRSRIKTTKINYFTPSYDIPQLTNSTPQTYLERAVPSAKDLLLPKLPLIKKICGQMSLEINKPLMTSIEDNRRMERNKKSVSHKVILSEPSVNTHNDTIKNTFTTQAKMKEPAQIGDAK